MTTFSRISFIFWETVNYLIVTLIWDVEHAFQICFWEIISCKNYKERDGEGQRIGILRENYLLLLLLRPKLVVGFALEFVRGRVAPWDHCAVRKEDVLWLMRMRLWMR